jgi:uncharacterized cupredoxin-like copper-binding protein
VILSATRNLAALAFLALAGCSSRPATPDPSEAASAAIDWTTAKTVTVDLTDFDFTPSTVRFESAQPVKLKLVNDGTDRHDFSAPAFFRTSALRQGSSTAPTGGKVSLAKGQSAEIDLVPGAPGEYPLSCTEFLHEFFGMTGTITVTPHHIDRVVSAVNAQSEGSKP